MHGNCAPGIKKTVMYATSDVFLSVTFIHASCIFTGSYEKIQMQQILYRATALLAIRINDAYICACWPPIFLDFVYLRWMHSQVSRRVVAFIPCLDRSGAFVFLANGNISRNVYLRLVPLIKELVHAAAWKHCRYSATRVPQLMKIGFPSRIRSCEYKLYSVFLNNSVSIRINRAISFVMRELLFLIYLRNAEAPCCKSCRQFVYVFVLFMELISRTSGNVYTKRWLILIAYRLWTWQQTRMISAQIYLTDYYVMRHIFS